MNPYGYVAIIMGCGLAAMLSIGALINAIFEESDKKQEPVPLTGVYIIEKHELADIENRLFTLERRLSELEER